MNNKGVELDTLRIKAETRVSGSLPVEESTRPAGVLLHELSVYQIELEMQNDELRRTQIALEESRDRYLGLYELAPVGYLTLTRTGQISEINLTGAEMLGVERKKLLKRRFAGFIAAGDSERWYHHFLNVLQHDGRRNCELTFRRGDDSSFHARLDCMHVKDGGEPSVRIALSDITESRLIEEELRIAAIAFESQEGMMVSDANGIILRVNQAFTRLTGYSEKEMVGKTPAMFKSGQQDNAFYQRMWATLNQEHYWQGEILNKHKNGSLYIEQLTIYAVVAPNGNITHYIGAYLDMAARKQIEAEKKRLDQVLQDNNAELERAKSAAEKANLAKSDFLSGMSHELRTPLHAILGFSQLLEAGSPPPTDSQAARLQQITRAGWYLLELINEILDLAVIESGKVSLSLEPVLLIDVMRECQAMIETQAQRHDIKLTFLPFDNSWFVSADQTRLKQVLINLLSNAIKYNRKQGTVEIECSEIIPERIRISIRDSGMGLDSEKLAQLFQPFNRLGQENGSEEGTGIGLVVTRKLVELMGGCIGVKSTVGAGSEFWIELIREVKPQLSAENTLPAEPALPHQENAKQHTLLYVEDNPANLMLVEQIIEARPDIHMLSARDGNLGIALARTHLPDVILMDINLPGISGIEALNTLRKDTATMHIPVVAISANAMPCDIEAGIEAGFFCYITKPIRIKDFMSALDAALKFSETKLDDTNK
ncbi:MAG: PAS domain S-box protein [Gallionella sp.]|jgi:PAS domain S-box-containing protein